MEKAKTQFNVHNQGFAFVNSFQVKIPVHYKLPFGGMVDLNEISFGLCGGMCFAALDYFHAKLPIPEFNTPAEIDHRLYTYLCERQLDSLKVPVVLKILEWMLVDEKILTTRMKRSEIPRLRRHLDKGEPVVLLLLRARGISNPTQNHQVLATGYELNPENQQMVIEVYDPNHPRQPRYIRLSLASSSPTLDLAQSSGEALFAFFLLPYHFQKPPLIVREPPAVVSFEVPLFHLRWPVDSRRVNQYFGENPDSYKPFGLPGHEGLDLFALSGANVYAAADGMVTLAGFPKNHPYGLHIRIQHTDGGRTFHTIYGHLSETLVKAGQTVSAGERIGLADNTGNSFGSHLHLTLKIDGEKTPGYPAGIVDPYPYLKDSIAEPLPQSDPLPPSGIIVYTLSDLNLRTSGSITAEVIGSIPGGEALEVLGEKSTAESKIGRQGEWLMVKTASGKTGFVAAWYVQDARQPFPPSDLIVYPFDMVNLRSGPAATFDLLATVTLSEPLTVLGDASLAEAKLGKNGEWLQVQTESGQRGFVAAWLVHKTGQPAPKSELTVYPTTPLNVRARPAADAHVLTVASAGEPMTVLGDTESTQKRIGLSGEWVNVRTRQQYSGYVAAWLVSLTAPTAPRAEQLSTLRVSPTAAINLRAQPSINSPRVSGANLDEVLTVIETDRNAARDKIGKTENWLLVQKGNGESGWAAAWLLKQLPG